MGSGAEECKFNPDEGTIRYRNKLDRMYFLLAQKVASQHLPVEYLVIALDSVLAVQHGLWIAGLQPRSPRWWGRPEDPGRSQVLPDRRGFCRPTAPGMTRPADGVAGALASEGWTIAG